MRWLKILGGSMVTYVVVAVCAGSGGGYYRSATMDASTIVDALTNPVPDALAGPTVSAPVPCSQSYQFSGSTLYYAEQAYPGKSATDLASVVAIIPMAGGPPGYTYTIVGSSITFVQDGYAAVICGNASYSAIFVLP